MMEQKVIEIHGVFGRTTRSALTQRCEPIKGTLVRTGPLRLADDYEVLGSTVIFTTALARTARICDRRAFSEGAILFQFTVSG